MRKYEARIRKLENHRKPCEIFIVPNDWKNGDPTPWRDCDRAIVLPGDFSCNRDKHGNPINHEGHPL